MLHYVTTNEGKVREAADYLGDAVEMVDFDYTEVQADELGPIAARGAREAFAHVGGPVIVDDTGLFVEALDGFPGPYSAYVEDTLGVDRVGELARVAAVERSGGENGDDETRDDETSDDEPVARAGFRCVLAYCDGDAFAATPELVDYGDRRGHDLSADDRDTASTTETVDAGTGEPAEASTSEPADAPVKLFEGWLPGRIVPPRGDGGFGYDPIFEHDGTTLAEMTTAEKNAVSHRGRALAKFADFYDERTD